MALLWIMAGVGSAVIMMAASHFAVRHAVAVAEKLHLPPFLIGITLVALGTDMPEILNSIVSSHLGHGDINVGDSIGSVFTQGSLALGLFPFVAGTAFRVERRAKRGHSTFHRQSDLIIHYYRDVANRERCGSETWTRRAATRLGWKTRSASRATEKTSGKVECPLCPSPNWFLP